MCLFPALLLLLLPGFSGTAKDVIGPDKVSGHEWGSLTVVCHYSLMWKTHRKWWCRGAKWSSCKTLIKTNGSEKEEKKGRLSIRDNQKDLMFSVTMKNLMRNDTGNYWCGIEKTGRDRGDRVQVTIVAGLHKESLSSVRPNSTLAPSTTEKIITYQPVITTSSATQLENRTGTTTRSLLSNTYFLLLVFLKLPLLLSMLGVVLWVNRPQRGPGGRQSQSDKNL